MTTRYITCKCGAHILNQSHAITAHAAWHRIKAIGATRITSEIKAS